jgi:hypothetical protein
MVSFSMLDMNCCLQPHRMIDIEHPFSFSRLGECDFYYQSENQVVLDVNPNVLLSIIKYSTCQRISLFHRSHFEAMVADKNQLIVQSWCWC